MPKPEPPDSDPEFNDFFLTESSPEDKVDLSSSEFELSLEEEDDDDEGSGEYKVISLDDDDEDADEDDDEDLKLTLEKEADTEELVGEDDEDEEEDEDDEEEPPSVKKQDLARQYRDAKRLGAKKSSKSGEPDEAEDPLPLSSLPQGGEGGALECPRCLSNVAKFKPSKDSAGGRSFHCPKCNNEVPLAFVQDFGKHPFVQFSLAGLSGNGKSCFLRGLFHSFNYALSTDWGEFSYEPLSDTDGKVLEKWLGHIEGGPLPGPNQLQVETVALRLYGIPGLQTLDLLMFDISGEAFTNVNLLQSRAFHVQRSDVVTLLISLDDIKNNFQLIRLLQDFQLGLKRMGANAEEKTLIVVLTKGDTLLADDSLPPVAREYLSNDIPLAPNDSSQLEELSKVLADWMDGHRNNYSGFVRNAKRAFKDVHYTVISALGFAPTGVQQQFAMQPRNVVSPLVWLLHESLPEVHLKTEEGVSRYFSLEEALKAAVDVDDACPTIEVGEGRYKIKETLLVQRPINLIGKGRDKTFIVGSTPEALMKVSAPFFRVAGIAFVREGTEPGNVVMVASTLFDIQGCDFQGGVRDVKLNRLGHGLVIQTPTKGPRVSNIKRCKALKNACGFHFFGQSRIHLENSRGENNQFGILISGQADVEVVDCTFRENTSGIDINDAGEVTLQNNKCEHNSNHGIYVRGAAQPQLTGNVCNLNKKDGIHVSGTARAVLTDNKASRNLMAGIRINTIGVTAVTGSRCEHNKECGIRITAGSKQTTQTSNACTQNGNPPDRKKDLIDERKKWF